MPVVVVVIQCLYEVYRHHRHLHSFPTRRSSDLADALGRRPADAVFVEDEFVRGSLGLDRKSTRLNSSHSSISYAVFCLKKKNTGVGGDAAGLLDPTS